MSIINVVVFMGKMGIMVNPFYLFFFGSSFLLFSNSLKYIDLIYCLTITFIVRLLVKLSFLLVLGFLSSTRTYIDVLFGRRSRFPHIVLLFRFTH